MEFKVLGPLEVSVGGRELPIGGTKQRALLAILLLHANRTITSEQLVDQLWGEDPPDSGVTALQVRVSQLRKALDPEGRRNGGGPLQTRPSGYQLEVDPDGLDLLRFERWCDEAAAAFEAGDPARACKLWRAANALWRGPAFADLSSEPFAPTAAAGLDERRTAALERWFDAELELGHHADLVAPLTTAVEASPLREHLTSQLMVALYRSGRQADALSTYRRTVQRLQDDLGVEPGDELTGLELAILRHDASLDAITPGPSRATATGSRPDEATSPGGVSGPSTARRRSRRWRATVAAALVVVVIGSVVVVRHAGGDTASTFGDLRSAGVGAVDGSDGRVLGSVALGDSPGGLVAWDGSLWASNFQDDTVTQIDPLTDTVHQRIPVGKGPSGIAAGAGSIWVADSLDGTVTRIDPQVGMAVKQISGVGERPGPVAFGAGKVWIASTLAPTIAEIDPRTYQVRTFRIDAEGSAVAFGAGLLWVVTPQGQLYGLDPQTPGAAMVVRSVGDGANSMIFAGGAIWVANTLDDTVSYVDPARQGVESVRVGEGPFGLAPGSHGGVWVTNELSGTMSWIAPPSDETSSPTVERVVDTGNRPGAAALVGDRVWVGLSAVASAHRGGTLRLRSFAGFETLDPATALIRGWVGATDLQLTNDGLVAFDRSLPNGRTGLVPDLAVSVPTPTGGGRTYAFRIRSDVRYSTGVPVRSSDFRHALERDFRLRPTAASAFYGDLEGAAACARQTARCDLSSGVVTDDDAGTVIFHLRRPDPDFLYALALTPAYAVPADVPAHEIRGAAGVDPIPATGPYMLQSVSRSSAQLVRNPYFRVWSQSARPDGFPDRIEWTFGGDPTTNVAAVMRGEADWSLDRPSIAQLSDIRARASGQLTVSPSDGVMGISFAPVRAPFSDVAVRQALALAVDRRAVIRRVGALSAGQPTCQMLPPVVFEYEPYCPFTSTGTADGRPELARASRMVTDSGTAGMRIQVVASTTNQTNMRPVANYLAQVLRSIGYRPRVLPRGASPDPAVPELSFYDWVGDFPAASDFVAPLFACRAGGAPPPAVTGTCDHWLTPMIARAQREATTSPGRAARLWAAIDRRLTREAPTVPLYNPNEIDFVSARVGNVQVVPQLGPLLDQMWVR